ncbi:MAG: hypothetical protein RLZZ273_63 [Bacteroidota bacterium]|jgi:hypothetical protein
MTMNVLFVLLAMSLVLPTYGVAQMQQLFSHGDPTPEEQLMLEYINRARANPAEEGIRLMDTQDPRVQGAYQYFKIDPVATKKAFTTYPQRPPLAFHAKLIDAARVHTRDMDQNNFQGHTSSNGDELGTRYAKVSYASAGMYGENVAAYSESVWHGHCGLNVDWGEENQKELGHRSNIMNFGNAVYTEIGIGIIYNGKGLASGYVGPYVVTQDFGIGSTRYVVGVVYDDKNKNGFYDIGEGIPNVKLVPNRGSYYTVTSSSGGYALPYSGGSSLTIVASEGGLAAPITKNITVDGNNVKLDVTTSASAQGPGAVVLSKPANNATGIAPVVTLEWGKSTFAEYYEWQVSSTNQFTTATIVASGTETKQSTQIQAPQCNTRFFWRVRGMNTAGSGTWSNPFSFTTAGKLPTATAAIAPKGPKMADAADVVTFSWNQSTEATRYHFRVKQTVSPFSVVYEDTAVATTSTNVKSAVLGNGTFAWEVRPKNACGMSGWSTPAEFTLTVTSIDEVSDLATGILVRPQPVGNTASIEFVSKLAGNVVLKVRSLSGELIKEQLSAIEMGNAVIALPTELLAPGVYFVELIAPQGLIARTRFIK